MLKLWKKTVVANDVPAAEEMSFDELRSTLRRKIYREAFLYLPEAVRVKAIAMDISPLGARLRLTRSCFLPDELQVTVLDEVKREPARLAWKSGNDIGVEFVDPKLDPTAYFDSISTSEFDL